MELIWEMKKKKIMTFIKGPLIIALVICITLLTTWTLHILFSLYTDDQAHMSISEWIGHLAAKFL